MGARTHTHTHTDTHTDTHTVEYYSAITRVEIFHLHQCGWMDWEDVLLSEINQTENEKYHTT